MRTFVECGHRDCEEMAAVWFEQGRKRHKKGGRWSRVGWRGLRRIDMAALHTTGWTAMASPRGRSVTFRCPKHGKKKRR